MIKIEPLFATDYAQARALMRLEPAPAAGHPVSRRSLFLRGLAFWQHWLPAQLHVAPSVYVAKEDGVVLGLIVLRSTGKSRLCWQVDHLIVHPHHRGRGIAQELLRYVFALFGGQGASHFVAEVSDLNAAALSLYGSCGFRRCAKVVHYQLSLEGPDGGARAGEAAPFRLARPGDRQALFQLHQESLPPDIRMIVNYCPEDFQVSEFRLEGSQALRHRVMRRQGWFWVAEDVGRRVLTGAVRVSAHDSGDYRLELAIHPGWTEMAFDLVGFSLRQLRLRGEPAVVSVKAFDYQANLAQQLESHAMERVGDFSFLAREHWVRAKYPRKAKQIAIPAIPSPAINFPLATD